MNASEALAAWRQGGEVRRVDPAAVPGRLFADVLETSGVVVVVPTDAAALAWAAGTGAGLLLSRTPRPARDRLLGRGPRHAGVLVTSVDSLHSEVLRSDLEARLSGLPWCVWWADRLEPVRAGHGGRKAWVRRYHEACGGAGLLWLYADARSAEGLDAEEPDEPTGSVLVLPDGPALAEVFAHFGGGVVAAPTLPGGMGPGLQAEGLPLRSHGGARSDEQEALDRIREGIRGVDHLIGPGRDAAPVYGRVTLLSGDALLPADLAVPAGSSVALIAEDDPAVEVDEASVERCLRCLESARVGEAFALSGDETDAPQGLLEDLEAAGWLEALRAAPFSAVVSDQHRLRPPFTDRHPAFRAFQRDYASAQGAWSLREQAELALTDRAPQDLRRLAGAMGRSTVDLALLLRALDQESVVTARLRPLGGAADWEARPGPRWGESAALAARAVGALRERRAELRAEVRALLDGTREQLGNGPRRAEGRHEVSVSDRARLPGRAGTVGKPVELPPSLRGGGRSARPSADALFSGLSARPAPKPAAPAPRPWTPQRAVEVLLAGDPEALRAAADELGGAGVLLARAAYDHRAPGRPPGPPDAEAAGLLLEALIHEASPLGLPAGLPGGASAKRSPRGHLEVDVPDGAARGVHRFELRVAAERLPGWAAAVADLSADVARWASAKASLRAWQAFAAAARDRVIAATEAEDPDAALLAAPPVLTLSSSEAAPEWRPLFEAVEGAVRGEIDEALERTQAIRRADLRTLQAYWLGASGRWSVLAQEGLAALDKRSRIGERSPRERLALRALPLSDPLPRLDAQTFGRWLAEVPSPVPIGPSAERLLAAVGSGRPRDFSDLAARFAERGLPLAGVAARAMELGALPGRLAATLLEEAGPEADAALRVRVLRAATGRPGRATTAWQQLFGVPGEAAEEALLPVLEADDDELARALLDAGRRRAARRLELDAQRERIVRLDQDGRSEEAARALSALPASDRRALAEGPEDLQATREAALARLNRFGAVLARVLASSALPDPDREAVEAEARAALDDARREGWSELVLQALRAQHRRHPDDPQRARWLAEALIRAERWSEAEEAWSRAVEGSAPADARALGLDAAEGFLRAGQDKRALRTLERMLAGPPHRGTGVRLAEWADEGLLRGRTAERIAQLLRRSRSGVYAAALRRLS